MLVHQPEVHHTDGRYQTLLTVQKDVFCNTQMRDQRQLLVNGADPQVLGALRVMDLHRLSLVKHGSPVFGIHAGDNLDQRRFPGSILTDKPQNLAGIDLKVHILQGLDAGETLGNAFHSQ